MMENGEHNGEARQPNENNLQQMRPQLPPYQTR